MAELKISNGPLVIADSNQILSSERQINSQQYKVDTQPAAKIVNVEKSKSLETGSIEKSVTKKDNIEFDLNKMNEGLDYFNRRVERHIHKTTKTPMYKILDSKTDEVIREFPPEELQDMIGKMREAAGLILNITA